MRLHARVYGHGQPLTILHGLFGSHENWHSISLALARQFQVFAVDQRNHGLSPHSPEMDYRLMADDLAEFLTENRLSRAHILGHSMGGKTAMQFALSYPDRVQKLVVVDIAPRAYQPRHDRILSALLGLDIAVAKDRRQLEHALASAIPDLPTRRFLLKNLKRKPDGSFYWQLGLHEIQKNYSRLGEALTAASPFIGPALFVRGELSEYLRETDLPAIKNLFPKAELETIPGAGHLPHVENPPALLERLNAFLSRG